MQYLQFLLGEVEFAIDLDIIDSVAAFNGGPLLPHPLPQAQESIAIRGRKIPIFGLRERIGLPSEDKAKAKRIIIFSIETSSNGRVLIGSLVDWVGEVLNIEEAHFIEPSSVVGAALGKHFLKGVASYEGRPIIVLAAEELFTPDIVKAISSAA
jgi:purine-binding chemotaxis protein CheW